MRYVAGVSWPRSGHHLLERLLAGYYGSRFRYFNPYTKGPNVRDFLPLDGSVVHYTKYHGEEALPVIPGTPYLIQIRHIVPSTISHFELEAAADPSMDTAERFAGFLDMKIMRYNHFVREWVTRVAATNEILVMPHETMTANPEARFADILRFFETSPEVDDALVSRVVQGMAGERHSSGGIEWDPSTGVREQRRTEDFRYFDRDRFARAEEACAESLRVVGIGTRWR